MGWIWAIIGAVIIGLFWVVARRIMAGDHGERVTTGGPHGHPHTADKPDLWPDRTGAQTKYELGAENPVDMTFVGDRPEHRAATGAPGPNAAPRGNTQAAPRATAETGPIGAPGAGETEQQVRRDVALPANEDGPGSEAAADLAPEDEFGEDRPAQRTTAPDAPPTQWDRDAAGVPGDHKREGHHRSATAPTKRADTTDPYAHAPIPGPNHIIPDEGDRLPPGTQP